MGAAGAERVILRRRSGGGLNGDNKVIRILEALGVCHMAACRYGPGEPKNLLFAVIRALAQDPRMRRRNFGIVATSILNRPNEVALPKARSRGRDGEQAGSTSHVTSPRQGQSLDLVDPPVESKRSPRTRKAIAPPTEWWRLAGS